MAWNIGGDNNSAMLASNSVQSDKDSKVDANKKINNLFANTKEFKDVTKYNLMRGVPDFGSLVQFNPYETGYAAFIICGMPKFIEALALKNDDYNKLMQNWMHVVEYEFKSFDGLQDITAESLNIGDDLNSMPVISKVTMQSNIEFTLNYTEKSGSLFAKFSKLYLTGLKDPRTQVKTYHGLIHSGEMEPGFENEVFTFLYINTDNTMRNVEAAYLLLGCQLTSADVDMYNYQKGTIDHRDTQLKFTGFPVTSPEIDLCAQDMMRFLLSKDASARQIIVNSDSFNYTGIDAITKTLKEYGASDGKYTSLKHTNDLKYDSNSYYDGASSSGAVSNT